MSQDTKLSAALSWLHPTGFAEVDDLTLWRVGQILAEATKYVEAEARRRSLAETSTERTAR